nr:PLDc N-terminal domain-containing protein [Marinicella gelatinilytica]
MADPFFGYGWGGGIIGLIILILDIIAIVEILSSGKSAGEKLLWVLVILFLPLIGLILYYLLGRK